MKWISVEDRLPEFKTIEEDGIKKTEVVISIIVWDDEEKTSYPFPYSQTSKFSNNPNITHWMYFPVR